ncbi:hypothetical protein BJ165DRAFT_32166 [Panaeolus papilionaceus]|nr:hypothetical protein BJ165DRAFT_32166 [Panaeolus papilionaceus]
MAKTPVQPLQIMFKPIPSNPLFISATDRYEEPDSLTPKSPNISSAFEQMQITQTQSASHDQRIPIYVGSTPCTPLQSDQQRIFIEYCPVGSSPYSPFKEAEPSAASADTTPNRLQLLNLGPLMQSMHIPIPETRPAQNIKETHVQSSSSSRAQRPAPEPSTPTRTDTGNPTLSPPQCRVPTVPAKRKPSPSPIPAKRPRVEITSSNTFSANDANTNKCGVHHTSSGSNVHHPKGNTKNKAHPDNNINTRPCSPSNLHPQSEVHRAESSINRDPKIPLRQTNSNITSGQYATPKKSQGSEQRPSTNAVSHDAKFARVEQKELNGHQRTMAHQGQPRRPAENTPSQAPISGKPHKAHNSPNSSTLITTKPRSKTKPAAPIARKHAPIAQPGPPQPQTHKPSISKLKLFQWKNELVRASYLLKSGKLTPAEAMGAFKALNDIDTYQRTDNTVWNADMLQETGLMDSVKAVCGIDSSGDLVDEAVEGKWDDRSRIVAVKILRRWQKGFLRVKPAKTGRT